ncbi:MAG: hypothetical protein WBX25_05395 [Rhodomicrobium sp.]
MFLRSTAACLIFLSTAGWAAEAEECQGNPGSLGTSRVITLDTSKHRRLPAEQWAMTLEAPAGTSARSAAWASPWLVQAVPSSLPAAKAEQWAMTLEAPAGTAARSAAWASPWLVQAIHSCLPAAKAAHTAASKLQPLASAHSARKA